MKNVVGRCLLLLGVLAAGIPASQAEGTIEDLRALWHAGSYQAAYDGLKQYRKQPYGKTFEVYYMAGTSLCRLSSKADLGVGYLQWVLDNYSLGKEARRTVEREQQNCPPNISGQPVVIAYNTTAATAGVSGRTKMFYYVESDNALRSVPVEVVEEIPREVLVRRLFPASAVDSAERSAAERTCLRARMGSSEHFVLASLAGHSPAQLEQVAEKLERVYGFFISEYGMREPESLITAYMVRDLDKLQQLARSLHGIKVAPQSLGYSYRDDMSMVGYVPRTGVGTLLHEMFHLMVRNDFGDIPPWLDEGLAALYEVSVVTDESVQGTQNWRGGVLQELWGEQPSVEELVKMNWLDFSGGETEHDTTKQAANHAKARYLMLFLQERGLLTSVYRAFQAREVGTDSAELLESVMGEDLDNVEEEFKQWFHNL